MNIAVLGCGAWGTALATMLAAESSPVILWGRDEQVVESINSCHRNPAYLGDVALSKSIRATSSLSQACKAKTILCVTPAQVFGQLRAQLKPLVGKDAALILCAKGIDRESGLLLHQLAAETFGSAAVAALSGPSFAADVARGLPTAVSLAAHSTDQANSLAKLLARPKFRIYATDDMVGVEVGGALKNVLAVAVGVARGLALGASAEAALIARGFSELNRVAQALGARRETLAGLSGLGDLVLSCSSPQSRNFSYGIALAKGEDLTGRPLAEGVHSAEMALGLARRFDLDVPIIGAVVSVLAGEIAPKAAVNLLLERPLRGES